MYLSKKVKTYPKSIVNRSRAIVSDLQYKQGHVVELPSTPDAETEPSNATCQLHSMIFLDAVLILVENLVIKKLRH
jgi:hypothetical protein